MGIALFAQQFLQKCDLKEGDAPSVMTLSVVQTASVGFHRSRYLFGAMHGFEVSDRQKAAVQYATS